VANQSPSLYLPGRYQKDQQELERPLDYAEVDETSGRVIVICNAKNFEGRIPVDEMKGMLQARKQKALSRGDAQRAADVNASLRDFWNSRKMWVKDRMNNAIRYGWVPPSDRR